MRATVHVVASRTISTRRRFAPAAAAAAVFGLLLAPVLTAFETDQFLVLDVELEDSTEVVNGYVNDEIEHVLERVNSRRRVPRCEQLPAKIYRHLFLNLLSSRIKYFLEHSPDVARFPPDGVGYWEYLQQSVYRRPIFPYIMPMSSTVNVGGIYVGVDKFGHMMGEGRRYYKDLRRALARGLDEEEALRRVIRRRLRLERVIFGGLSNGVVSFADLEGNYQGLRLARAMCEGPQPHLVRGGERWRLARPVRIEDYMVPALDETFNPNRFPRGRWKRVRPVLLSEHCPKLEHPVYRARLERYQARHVPSPSHRVLEEYFSSRSISVREHSLVALCSQASDLAEATAERSMSP